MKPVIIFAMAAFALFIFFGCGNKPHRSEKSYAIYAEYAKDSNKIMQNGLNRRIFDSIEVQEGKDIALGKDGSITLQAGTYRITGFSTVTMQGAMTAPVLSPDSLNYPGYALLYLRQHEDSVLQHHIGISSAAPAFNTTPCLFDLVYTCREKVEICVGHQVGDDLKDTVYLSVYEPAGGVKSPYHVCARIAITKL